MKKHLFLLCLIFVLIDVNTSFSQDRYDVGLCMGVYFDLMKLKMDYQNKLRKVETDMKTNEQHIIEINKLLAEIQRAINYGTEQERKNAILAEPVAQSALRKAKEKERSLSRQKIELQMLLDRLSQEEKNISDLCKTLASMKAGGVLRNCSGDIKIISKGSKETGCSMHSIINEGDVITTGADGKATLYLLNGRGQINLEPNTTLRILKDTKEEQIIEFAQGKAELGIKKHQAFAEKFQDFMKNVKELFTMDEQEFRKKVQEWFSIDDKELKKLTLWVCKILTPAKCHKPHVTMSVRGTAFEIDKTVDNEVKIYVKEGTVELTIYEDPNPKIVILEEAYEAILNLENNAISMRKK